MKGICTLDSGHADISALCVCACSFEVQHLSALNTELIMLYFCYVFMPYVHNKFAVADPFSAVSIFYFIVKHMTLDISFYAWVQSLYRPRPGRRTTPAH